MQAEESLFRAEAIRSLANTSLGRPVSRMPRAWVLLGGLCVLLFIVLVAFLDRTHYARRERVRGWLVAEQGVARISHDRGGRVAGVFVAAGRPVTSGDPILRVSMSRTTADGASASAQAKETLGAELAEIEAQQALARQRAETAESAIRQQLQSVEKELQRLDSERGAYEERLRAVERRTKQVESAFARGAISEQELLAAQEALAAQRQAGAQILQRRTRIESSKAELVAGLTRTSLDLDAETSRLRTARLRVLRELSDIDVGADVLLTAPIDGEVASIEVTSGSAIMPGQLLATIVPQRYTLAAEVFAPSRSLAGIEVGDMAALSYDAFPAQRFGIARGRVDSISGMALLPGDLPQPFAMREPAYKVRVALLAPDDEGVPAESLRHGMMLNADFVLERRSLLQWVLGLFDGLGGY